MQATHPTPLPQASAKASHAAHLINTDGLSFVDTVRLRTEAAVHRLGFDDSMQTVLGRVKRELIVHFPVERDDGSFTMFTGFRVQHSMTLGPCLGGLRYRPSMSLDDARGLAMLTTWKTALVGLPFGGATGGIICDPKLLSLSELERLTRRFTTEVGILLGPERDVPAPDLGTSPEVMAWIMDTLSMHHGYSMPASVTGKPLEIGGSEGRLTATGKGMAIVMHEALKLEGSELRGKKVAIQGLGHTGQSTAEAFTAAGAIVVAMSDSQGGLFLETGLPIGELVGRARKGKPLGSVPGATRITNDALLMLPVDIIVLAAVESQITAKNAASVRAPYVIEGANGPIDIAGDAVLAEHGITVLPDLIANVGGIIVSYFEWVQDLQAFFWTSEEVETKLERIIARGFAKVVAYAGTHNMTYRQAAYDLAVGTVGRATQVRGIYP